MNLVWLKKDLRIEDNEALTRALSSDELLVVYVYEDEIVASEEYSKCHHEFLNECLDELNEKLEKRGSGIHTLKGRIPEVFEKLHTEHPFDRIYSHEETGTMITYQRDIRLKKWCEQKGVRWKEYCQTGVVRALRTRDGWAQKWQKTMNITQFRCPAKLPKPPFSTSFKKLSLEDLGKDGEDKPERLIGGSSEAHRVLQEFLFERGQYYSSEMSSPLTAWHSCSRISPYLSFGAISMRQVHQTLETRKLQLKSLSAEDKKGWGRSLSAFQGRLRWHCHFMQKLEDEPRLERENLNTAYDELRTDFDEENLEPL